MTNIVPLIAIILTASVFIATVIVSRLALILKRERDAWMNGLLYLEQHPGDVSGALALVQEVLGNEDFDIAAARQYRGVNRGN